MCAFHHLQIVGKGPAFTDRTSSLCSAVSLGFLKYPVFMGSADSPQEKLNSALIKPSSCKLCKEGR